AITPIIRETYQMASIAPQAIIALPASPAQIHPISGPPCDVRPNDGLNGRGRDGPAMPCAAMAPSRYDPRLPSRTNSDRLSCLVMAPTPIGSGRLSALVPDLVIPRGRPVAAKRAAR